MWFGPFFGKYLPSGALDAVQIVHGEEALLAATFIFSIHFINAHLRPNNFSIDTSIFTGLQIDEEFKERHPENMPASWPRKARTGPHDQTSYTAFELQ